MPVSFPLDRPHRFEVGDHGGARFTVNGGPDFVVLTEDEESESQSLERPHHE
jgi:hypothetical protein